MARFWRALLALPVLVLAACSRPAGSSWEASAPTVSEDDAIRHVERTFDYRKYYTNEFVRLAEGGPPPAVSPVRRLRLGLYWVANDQIAPWFVGMDKGFFRDVGLDLSIVEGGPQRDNLGNLAGGSIDLYAGFAESIYQEITSRTGTALMMVCANLKGTGNAWIGIDRSVPRDRRSTLRITADALRGRRIGVPTGAEYWVEFVLDHYHLAPGDLTLVNVGPTPDGLIAGTVDYFQGWYDDQPRLLDHAGWHNYTVLRFDDLGYRSYSYISCVTRDYYRANPGVLRAYVYALRRSIRYLLDYPDESAALVARDCKAYALTPAEVKWRIETDRSLFVGDGSEPLLAFDDRHMLLTVAQLYRYHQIELPDGGPSR